MSKDSINRRPKSMNDTPDDFVMIPRSVPRLSVSELNSKVVVPIRKTQSFGSDKMYKRPHGLHKPTVNVIEEKNEMEIERSGKTESGRFERNGSMQKIGISNNPYRKSDRSERSISGSGMVNNGYVGSGPSSINGGSIKSLPVIREQYCSCTRWTKLEKLLIIIVGILVLVVVALIISLGVLVDDKDRHKHWWAF